MYNSKMCFCLPQFFIIFFTLIFHFPSRIYTEPSFRVPPHATADMLPIYRVQVGGTIRIDCPIVSGPDLDVHYEWQKDGEIITPGWDRFRITQRKLRIKDASPEDGGSFHCKGTNGFGSIVLSTRLLIEDENGNILGGNEEERNGEGIDSSTNKNFFSSDEILEDRPSFTEISEPPFGSTFRPTVGSTLNLRCKVSGNPSPTVSWYFQRTEGQIPKGQTQELQLTELTYEDSGIYTCIATNIYGKINASFIVDVAETGMEGPTIMSLESSNLTAGRGQLIYFRCLISSDTLPNVQWLRTLDSEEIESNAAGLQMAGVRYKVISSGIRITSYSNGTYLSELSLPIQSKTTEIVCLATNSGGYKFQSKRINHFQQEHDSGENGDSDTNLPIAMLIAIPGTLILLSLVLSLIFCCFRGAKGRSQSLGTVTTTTYATPRDAMSNEYEALNPPVYTKSKTNSGHRNQHILSYPPNYSHQQQLSHRPILTAQNTMGGNSGGFIYNSIITNMDTINSPMRNIHQQNQFSPAYASVPICDTTGSTSGSGQAIRNGNSGPPLPSRTTFPISQSSRERNNFNLQGIMTQPLLTQTASSSDSRESRTSGGTGRIHRGGIIEVNSLLPTSNQRQPLDHWCINTGVNDGSWERKKHQIRV